MQPCAWPEAELQDGCAPPIQLAAHQESDKALPCFAVHAAK